MNGDAWDTFALHWLIVFGAAITALCLADALWRAWQARRDRSRRVVGRRVARPEWHCRQLRDGRWIVERRR